MPRKQDKSSAGPDLARLIARNRSHIEEATRELQDALLKAGIRDDVPEETLREARELYCTMRTRLLEIESVQRLLSQRQQQSYVRDPDREKAIIDLDLQIQELDARLGIDSPGSCTGAAPSDQWLKDDAARVSFTKNLRLLDELEYGPPRTAARKAAQQARTVEEHGRGFTLFSIRGHAASIDAILPSITLREHDIVERFSAYEIRGVLTHLRQTTMDDVKGVFERLLTTQFPEIKCILIELRSPDHLDEALLDLLERTAGEMRQGEMRTIDLAQQGG
jgi:hypothetical protein